MQLTFGDAEGLGKRKQTRREIFLAEMEQVVPWQQLLGLIAPHYPVSPMSASRNRSASSSSTCRTWTPRPSNDATRLLPAPRRTSATTAAP